MKAKRRKLPPTPALIERLRGQLGITQSALAQKLKVSAMSVSRWERGVQEPSSQIFVRLGHLASDQLKWDFWELAGLEREQVESAQASRPRVPAHAPSRSTPVPLLDAHLGASLTNDFVTDSETIEVISAPANWAPTSARSVCAFVEGDSMEPRIQDGSIACFDTTQTEAELLAGNIVVAQHPEKGTKLAWLERDAGGLHFRSEDLKVPRIDFQGEWHIVGKLLWWVTQTA